MIQVGLRIVLAVVIAQAVSGAPARIGDWARRLSNRDVAEMVSAVTSATGKPTKPWLITGGQRENGDPFAYAFLPEESQTINFRRNAKVLLTRPSNRGPWNVTVLDAKSAGDYAQVAVPGRSLDSIIGDRDINQPFQIYGGLKDSELVAIVTLIRSSPPSSQVERVPGSWPIEQIWRRPDGSIGVSLRDAREYSGTGVILQGESDNWKITETYHWVY